MRERERTRQGESERKGMLVLGSKKERSPG